MKKGERKYDAEKLRRMWEGGVDVDTVAAAFGTTPELIRRACERYGIKRTPDAFRRIRARNLGHVAGIGAFRPTPVPTHVNPLVRRIFEEMNRQQIGMTVVAERAGYDRTTMQDWRTRNNPSLPLLVAAGEVLGLELVWRRKREE